MRIVSMLFVALFVSVLHPACTPRYYVSDLMQEQQPTYKKPSYEYVGHHPLLDMRRIQPEDRMWQVERQYRQIPDIKNRPERDGLNIFTFWKSDFADKIPNIHLVYPPSRRKKMVCEVVNLAMDYRDQKRYAEAILSYHGALTLIGRMNDSRTEKMLLSHQVLLGLAECYVNQGRIQYASLVEMLADATRIYLMSDRSEQDQIAYYKSHGVLLNRQMGHEDRVRGADMAAVFAVVAVAAQAAQSVQEVKEANKYTTTEAQRRRNANEASRVITENAEMMRMAVERAHDNIERDMKMDTTKVYELLRSGSMEEYIYDPVSPIVGQYMYVFLGTCLAYQQYDVYKAALAFMLRKYPSDMSTRQHLEAAAKEPSHQAVIKLSRAFAERANKVFLLSQ